MQIDLTNVQTNEFLEQEGSYTLKVTKVDTQSFTNNGNTILKVSMETKDSKSYTEDFVITENSLWKLKLFTKALKMPNVIETDLMLNRYVEGHFIFEDYTKKDGTTMKILKAKSWSPTKLTNTLEEMPQQTQQQVPTYEYQNMEQTTQQQVPTIDIDEDEIPF